MRAFTASLVHYSTVCTQYERHLISVSTMFAHYVEPHQGSHSHSLLTLFCLSNLIDCKSHIPIFFEIYGIFLYNLVKNVILEAPPAAVHVHSG